MSRVWIVSALVRKTDGITTTTGHRATVSICPSREEAVGALALRTLESEPGFQIDLIDAVEMTEPLRRAIAATLETEKGTSQP